MPSPRPNTRPTATPKEPNQIADCALCPFRSIARGNGNGWVIATQGGNNTSMMGEMLRYLLAPTRNNQHADCAQAQNLVTSKA
jgi:hypothetical protein